MELFWTMITFAWLAGMLMLPLVLLILLERAAHRQ